MGTRLPDTLTRLTAKDVAKGLWSAWLTQEGSAPRREAILVLLSQWACETGWGASMHCFNLGNVKASREGACDFTYFGCGEDLSITEANRQVALDPAHAKIGAVEAGPHGVVAHVRFEPDHPTCCFAAFDSLEAGSVFYLALLRRRFAGAWPSVVRGDIAGFAEELKRLGYYTAAVDTYRKALTGIYSMLDRQLPAAVFDNLPVVPTDIAERVWMLMLESLDESVNEGLFDREKVTIKE